MKRTNRKSLSHRWVVRQVVFGLALALVTTFALVFHFSGRYTLAVGDVASQDIRAPQELTYVSEIRTEQAREAARRQIQPIYTSPDLAITRERLERVRLVMDFFDAVRTDPYASDAEKRSWVLAVEELQGIPNPEINTLLSLSESDWNDVRLETRALLNQVMQREEIRMGNIGPVRERVPALVPLDLPQDEANLVAVLVQRFIVPNSFYDQIATEQQREAATAEVSRAFETIRRGEVIVREGSVVSDLQMEALEELGLTARQVEWQDVILLALLAVAGTVVFGTYLYRMQREVLLNGRKESLVLLLMIAFILLARLLIPAGPMLLYLFPAAALGMLLVSTTGYITALGAVLYLGAVAGWIGNGSLLVMVLVVLNGAVASLTLPRYEQTGAIFRSGILGGFAGAVVRLAFATTEAGVDLVPFLMESGVSLTGGVISGGLTLGGLFLLAPLFDLATTFRLVELSHPNHPLLQRLLREAPATFHHVMMVASMAEQAAERIGANALLTRAGTYYHDIGKLARPYFFVENQEGLNNPHDRLDPETSVGIVMGHVLDGIQLAKQYRLPAQVRAFIPEHHGTMRVSFFYYKAVEAAGGEEGVVEEVKFRYPGPRPQSAETALVMLADGSEAATRAARPSSAEEVAEIVDSIVEARIRDGQLDECSLTLQELEIVKDTYVEILRGAYHPRIRYPGSKTEAETEK
ncbi:MAG: HD family phosphohydrolase [Anaerolineales bacterium]